MTPNEIIAANPLETFLSNRGFDLRTSGQHRVTNACPVGVHKKHHRPVTINVEKQLWHCNDCNVGGTVIEWVARERGCDAAEAKRILGGRPNGAEERGKLIKTYDYRRNRAITFSDLPIFAEGFQATPTRGGRWLGLESEGRSARPLPAAGRSRCAGGGHRRRRKGLRQSHGAWFHRNLQSMRRRKVARGV